MFNDVILSFMINFNFKDLLSNIGHRPNVRYGIETETKTGNEWTLTLNKLTFISNAISFVFYVTLVLNKRGASNINATIRLFYRLYLYFRLYTTVRGQCICQRGGCTVM